MTTLDTKTGCIIFETIQRKKIIKALISRSHLLLLVAMQLTVIWPFLVAGFVIIIKLHQSPFAWNVYIILSTLCRFVLNSNHTERIIQHKLFVHHSWITPLLCLCCLPPQQLCYIPMMRSRLGLRKYLIQKVSLWYLKIYEYRPVFVGVFWHVNPNSRVDMFKTETSGNNCSPPGLQLCPFLTCVHSFEFNKYAPIFEESNKRVMHLTHLSLVIFVCFAFRVVNVS